MPLFNVMFTLTFIPFQKKKKHPEMPGPFDSDWVHEEIIIPMTRSY